MNDTTKNNRKYINIILVSLFTFTLGLVIGSHNNKQVKAKDDSAPLYLSDRINIHEIAPNQMDHLYQVTPYSISEDGVTTKLSESPSNNQLIWVVTLDNDRIKLFCKPVKEQLP